MGKNIGKNVVINISICDKQINKSMCDKYSLKLHKYSHAKNVQQIHLQLLQKTLEATDDLIGNKIANKIKKVAKISQQNYSETVANNNDKEIPKERYLSPEERQEFIDELGLKYCNNGISKNLKVSKNSQNNDSDTVTNLNN